MGRIDGGGGCWADVDGAGPVGYRVDVPKTRRKRHIEQFLTGQTWLFDWVPGEWDHPQPPQDPERIAAWLFRADFYREEMRNQARNGYDLPVPPGEKMFPVQLRSAALYALLQIVVDVRNSPFGYAPDAGYGTWWGRVEDAPVHGEFGTFYFSTYGELSARQQSAQRFVPAGLPWTHDKLTAPMQTGIGRSGRRSDETWERTFWADGSYVWCPSPLIAIPYFLGHKAIREDEVSAPGIVSNFYPVQSFASLEAYKDLYGRMLCRWGWVAHWYLMRQTVDEMLYPRRRTPYAGKAGTGSGGGLGSAGGNGPSSGPGPAGGSGGVAAGPVGV